MIGEITREKLFVVCGRCAGWFDPDIGCPVCEHGEQWREESHHAKLPWDRHRDANGNEVSVYVAQARYGHGLEDAP